MCSQVENEIGAGVVVAWPRVRVGGYPLPKGSAHMPPCHHQQQGTHANEVATTTKKKLSGMERKGRHLLSCSFLAAAAKKKLNSKIKKEFQGTRMGRFSGFVWWLGKDVLWVVDWRRKCEKIILILLVEAEMFSMNGKRMQIQN